MDEQDGQDQILLLCILSILCIHVPTLGFERLFARGNSPMRGSGVLSPFKRGRTGMELANNRMSPFWPRLFSLLDGWSGWKYIYFQPRHLHNCGFWKPQSFLTQKRGFALPKEDFPPCCGQWGEVYILPPIRRFGDI
jgi:hypothetical protein